jgi:DNA primase
VRQRYGVFCYNNKSRKSAYSGRVMLPVKDLEGQLYGYLGRAVGQTDCRTSEADVPKYLFPPKLPKSRFLFGLFELVHPPEQEDKLGYPFHLPLKRVYLVESPFCVLKFAMWGLPAVSPFGWSISDQQLDILCSIARGLIYLPDKNKYHESGSVVSTLARRLWVRCPELPDGCDDPEHLPNREAVLALHA